jgi:ADP-heptose:LPS heptosyltransferase
VPARILVARPDHLGDVLLTLPAAAALRAALPGTSLALLVSTSIADTTRRCPDVDETLTVPFPALGTVFPTQDWDEIAHTHAQAMRDRFDIAVLARPDDPWSGSLVDLAEIPIRIGYAVPGMERFLTHSIQLHEKHHAAVQTLRLMEKAARCLGIGVAGQHALNAAVLSRAPVPFVPAEDEEALVHGILAEVPSAGRRPVVFQPGSGWPLKNWAPQRWGRLGIEIRRRYGLTPPGAGWPRRRPAGARDRGRQRSLVLRPAWAAFRRGASCVVPAGIAGHRHRQRSTAPGRHGRDPGGRALRAAAC